VGTIGDIASLSFSTFAECEMCGAPASDARVLGRRLNARQGLRPRRASGITTTIHRCRHCGLVFANPMPLPRDMADHYAVDPSEYWADATTAPEPGYFEEEIATFRRLWTGRDSAATALDLGAGLGKAMVKLSRHGFDAYGVEFSAPFREAAITENGIPGDRLLLGRIEDVGFDRASFDFITFGAVLEHLPAPSSAIERALGWLRPGGLIHIEVPSANWLMARVLDRIYQLQGLDYTCHLSPLHVPFHLFEFTVQSFERHAERLGYQLAEHRHHVCDTFAPRWISPMLTRVMELSRTGLELEVWLRA
jgi:SAM-dependent methyltransferase